MMVDVSKGVGGDYSTFSVVDITESPYVQVAKYRNNTISPTLFPSIIYKVATEYNNALVLIESNISEQVGHILYHEYEYEHVLRVFRTSKGQQISNGWQSGSALGVQMDRKVKSIGCTSIKHLIEENKLIIKDADTISEFSTFIERRGSFSADDGYHDDLVMTLVLFGWFATNESFKHYTTVDLRKAMYEKQMRDIEDNLIPTGFFSDGTETNNDPFVF